VQEDRPGSPFIHDSLLGLPQNTRIESAGSTLDGGNDPLAARRNDSRKTPGRLIAYLLTTSDPSLSTEDVALGYKQLLEAERSFRDLRGHPATAARHPQQGRAHLCA
jgi:hypothetical protein